MSDRIRKINELVREEASRAILEHLGPNNFVTVTAVETAPDLKNATIWVSVLTDEKMAMDELEANKSVIQHEITSKMATKYTPKITFRIDKSGEHAARIDELLREDKRK